MARKESIAHARFVDEARSKAPTGLLSGSILGAIGVLLVISQVTLAATVGEFSHALAFVGGFAVMMGTVLTLTPNLSPDTSAHSGSETSFTDGFNTRHLARWVVALVVGGIGGMLTIMLSLRAVST